METPADAEGYNIKLPSTNDAYAQNSTTSPSQVFPSGNNTMNIGSGNNALTLISETLTVSNPSTTGFTVTLNPALNGLIASNFTLLNSMGTPVALTGAATSDNGTTYAISAALSAGQTYTLTAADAGYTFGTAQSVTVTSTTGYNFGTAQN